METPIGYPPPTLVVRRRPGVSRLRKLVLFATVATLLGIYVVDRLLAPPAAAPEVARTPKAKTGGVGDADSNPAALSDTAKALPMTIDAPLADTAPAQPSVDARKPNRWYYVAKLADGPGAIYSRSGGQWDFAFSCTEKTRMIEFIAVGTGSPGSFDQQSISVGKVKLMMDATYAKDGGGTMSTALPAAHPFFKALADNPAMEIRLHATRKTIVPVGSDVIRLIKACRGRA